MPKKSNSNSGEARYKFPLREKQVPDLLSAIKTKTTLTIKALEHSDFEQEAVKCCISLLLEVLGEVEMVEDRLNDQSQVPRYAVPVIDNIAESVDMLKILRTALDCDGYYSHENAARPLSIAIDKLTEACNELDK